MPTRAARREPVPPPAYCGTLSELCRAAGALPPVRLLAAADLAAGLRAPRGAILLPAIANGAWREIALFMLAHFAAAKWKVARRLFQGAAEDGYRPKQDTRKPDICMDRARSIHTIAAIQRTPVNPRWEISRRRVRGLFTALEYGHG